MHPTEYGDSLNQTRERFRELFTRYIAIGEMKWTDDTGLHHYVARASPYGQYGDYLELIQFDEYTRSEAERVEKEKHAQKAPKSIRGPNCQAVYLYTVEAIQSGSLECQNCGNTFQV